MLAKPQYKFIGPVLPLLFALVGCGGGGSGSDDDGGQDNPPPSGSGNSPIGSLTDSDSQSNQVQEYSGSGSLIGVTAFASDPDSNDTVSYRLLSDAQGRFDIDENSGVIRVADGSSLEASVDSSHVVQVIAESSDGSSSNASFTVTVLDDGCSVRPGGPSSSSYTVSWDTVTDPDLSGFTVYLGATQNLNKANADGSFTVYGNVTNTEFVPSDFAIDTCTVTYLAVATIGSRPESPLSSIQSVMVE